MDPRAVAGEPPKEFELYQAGNARAKPISCWGLVLSLAFEVLQMALDRLARLADHRGQDLLLERPRSSALESRSFRDGARSRLRERHLLLRLGNPRESQASSLATR